MLAAHQTCGVNGVLGAVLVVWVVKMPVVGRYKIVRKICKSKLHMPHMLRCEWSVSQGELSTNMFRICKQMLPPSGK